jgi:hypothetical protein
MIWNSEKISEGLPLVVNVAASGLKEWNGIHAGYYSMKVISRTGLTVETVEVSERTM